MGNAGGMGNKSKEMEGEPGGKNEKIKGKKETKKERKIKIKKKERKKE